MTNEEILKFQKRAKYVASRKGYPELADDFAQEIILTFLEGHGAHSTVDQLFIDYLRRTYGDSRSVCGSERAKSRFTTSSLDTARHIAADPEPERSDWRCAFLFTGKQAELYAAYFIDEKTQVAIADDYGVTESRVCQWLKPIKTEIQEYGILERGLQQMKDDPECGKLVIDWIRL